MTRICFALLVLLPGLPGCGPAGPPPFRMIPGLEKNLIHGDYDSTVIPSMADLDSFLDRLYQGSGDRGKGFREAIQKADLDFSKEALVILKHAEGSRSTRVTFKTPVLKSRKLICPITRDEKGVQLPVVKHHFATMAVDKSAVDAVELRVEGRKTVVLPVSAAK